MNLVTAGSYKIAQAWAREHGLRLREWRYCSRFEHVAGTDPKANRWVCLPGTPGSMIGEMRLRGFKSEKD